MPTSLTTPSLSSLSRQRPQWSRSLQCGTNLDGRPFTTTVAPGGVPGETVVAVQGEIDVLSAPLLLERLTTCVVAGCQRLTVDLSGVSFLGASALSVLVAASQDLGQQGGVLVVHRPRPMARRIMGITGVDRLPHIEVAECPVAAHDR